MKKDNSGKISRRQAAKIIGGASLGISMNTSLIARTPFFSSDMPMKSKVNSSKNIYHAYRSFWPELEATKEFKNLGINTRCFFASNTINSAGFEYCKYPKIWKGIKEYDFTAYDAQVEDLLSANNDANFMCIIDLNMPDWLARKFAYDSFSEISHAASDKDWIEITTEWMLDFIAYSEKKYGDKILTYILSGGGTSEWYEYDRGRSSRVKNKAWKEWTNKNDFSYGDDVPSASSLGTAAHENLVYNPETEMEKIQYWRFHNEVIADAILHFSKVARANIGEGKEIGVFYGYYLVSPKKIVSFGHLDYEKVFASPDIDFFISPGSYNDRQIGGGSGSQLIHGTLLRHNKQYLHEIDHRTHVIEKNAGSGWKTQSDDVAGLKREAFFALINNSSLWWFDMWGGWYQKKETQQLIQRLKVISDEYINDKPGSIAEVLMIADPQSAHYIIDKMPLGYDMAQNFRNKLNKTGTPFDVYSFNDIPEIDLSRYKVIFLPAMLLITNDREKILKNYILNENRTIVWTYAPGICDGRSLDISRIKEWTGVDYKTTGPVTVDMKGWKSVYAFKFETLTSTAMKKIMRDAGVHLYTDEENPVYANERLLAVHFKEGGKRKISLPKSCKKVINVYDNKVVGRNCSDFIYDFSSPDTVLFEILIN
ncbi:hypothetical protein KO529_04845 [Arenibacter algicola]|uniref:hypothetical protein n=1 Tax=Arenibacter algicola TaxID=616991 RepID=UPI001C06AF41|nr:hypothetical protein [Arenibacter algicola]MBU2904103.1 hypothetical protein [Arenibacter algicola]